MVGYLIHWKRKENHKIAGLMVGYLIHWKKMDQENNIKFHGFNGELHSSCSLGSRRAMACTTVLHAKDLVIPTIRRRSKGAISPAPSKAKLNGHLIDWKAFLSMKLTAVSTILTCLGLPRTHEWSSYPNCQIQTHPSCSNWCRHCNMWHSTSSQHLHIDDVQELIFVLCFVLWQQVHNVRN